jgi:leucyl aminopeptidase
MPLKLKLHRKVKPKASPAKEDYELNTAKQTIDLYVAPTKVKTLSELRKLVSAINWKSVSDTQLDLIYDQASFNEAEIAAIVEVCKLKSYIFDEYKTDETKKHKLISEVLLNGKEMRADLDSKITEAVLYCRDLVNKNASEVHPEHFELEAKKLSSKNIKVKVIDAKEAQKINLNCLLEVGCESFKNSAKQFHPRMIIIEYTPAKFNPKQDQHLCLVGKGITYDTGGLCLKPNKYMLDMKSDMAGAATVLSIFKLLSKLGSRNLPKAKISGVMALTENAFGASSYKPGDVITSYSRKTVEVVDTDAEGRLVLADALAYASRKLKPDMMIDLATLTGSIVATLGEAAAGAMTNDQEFTSKVEKVFSKNDEKIWLMPSFKEYKKLTDSTIADLAHCSSSPDALVAASFLENFVAKDIKWLHLDIAGTGFYEDESLFTYHGGSGFGVKSLYEFSMSL